MLGTMPDFSEANHIDLIGSLMEPNLLASVFTNSFGDKIIYYRKHTVTNGYGVTCSGFDTIGVSIYHEGNHPNFDEMLEEGKRLLNSTKDV